MASLQHARPAGALPSETEKNPKQLMAILFRSGKELSVAPPLHEEDTTLPEAELESRRKFRWKKSTAPPPFPQRLNLVHTVESTQRREDQGKVVGRPENVVERPSPPFLQRL
ncbi:hypothetical protein HAX54_046643 [Datura stramonium]|uniref:Uncharacterized protein n=1 Tax=Datura stramonium TaxID=4076 RepID=A0ABS8WJI1_DATST|nr:hypothetical protein [Datura stramonium]